MQKVVFFIASPQGQMCFRDLGVEMIQHTTIFVFLLFYVCLPSCLYHVDIFILLEAEL